MKEERAIDGVSATGLRSQCDIILTYYRKKQHRQTIVHRTATGRKSTGKAGGSEFFLQWANPASLLYSFFFVFKISAIICFKCMYYLLFKQASKQKIQQNESQFLKEICGERTWRDERSHTDQ
uniref:(northern house mosquito) hypothetical protein n=1 Tax=Culex pipiens TaxID=7175 RepID=A0A8D8G9E8_CULPI